MKHRILPLLLSAVILTGLILPAQAAGNISHGTATEWITEEMLNNTPPADYHVNSATQADAKDGLYNAFFLDEQLQTVRIAIEENNLNYLLQNAKNEPYVMTTSVTIGGTTVGYCGLRTKGNFTLQHSYDDNPGSDRFSFTVNFGKYITKDTHGEKQNFYGCEKISFNNFFFDKSMLKEYFAFKLMEHMGLPTPQYGLAKLYINDRYYGVYFMVEAMDETILEQYWNCDGKDISPYLMKPTGTNLNYEELCKDARPLYDYNEETYDKMDGMVEETLTWCKKLNQLSQGTDFTGNPIDVQSQAYLDLLDTVLETDEAVRYFAVASWLCQMDNMFTNFQNYGLYISYEGKATLLPWDYDLAFGCYYPSTAETTANYPLDVMYRLDGRMYDSEKVLSQRTYANFPLFHVIYQNDALMEKFHDYMGQCSQIATLGGTVEAAGKSYAPGYFNSCIEALSDPLLEAASEELADNVYYMNNIRQPQGVTNALENLSAIIAQRSVGVWLQVKGVDSRVCGAGCDLETLGNALTGEYSNSGKLTCVDPQTGIFTTAEYTGGKRKAAPALDVLAGDEQTVDAIREALQCQKKDAVLAYQLISAVKANSGYTVTVPVEAQYFSDGAVVTLYTWADGTLTPLETAAEGNLYTAQLDNLTTVVVLAAYPEDHTIAIVAGLGVAVLAAGAVLLVIFRKRRGKHES